VDADQRAAIIRDLDKYARDAASNVAFMSRKFRDLMESDDPGMTAADVVTADSALMDAMRALPELRRIFAKWARLLDGPPPSLMLGATQEPGHLDIIARAPGADLVVGRAIRSGTGDGESWRLRLTDADRDRIRVSIGLCYQATPEDLLEALNRHMDEHGPWWAGDGN
jgi:hypothetical protein